MTRFQVLRKWKHYTVNDSNFKIIDLVEKRSIFFAYLQIQQTSSANYACNVHNLFTVQIYDAVLSRLFFNKIDKPSIFYQSGLYMYITSPIYDFSIAQTVVRDELLSY